MKCYDVIYLMAIFRSCGCRSCYISEVLAVKEDETRPQKHSRKTF